MDFLVATALDCLAARGVRVERGLAPAEFERLERTFRFRFGPEQHRLLAAAMPISDGWVDWRDDDAAHEALERPIREIVAAVLHRGFWLPGWGRRPPGDLRAERATRHRLREVPALVPLHAEHYLPGEPMPCGSPVFSLLRIGVVSHGETLLDHVEHHFGRQRRIGRPWREVPSVPFWSDLASRYVPSAPRSTYGR
ncbi:MAG TPA: hypothetical protein VI248_05045 [Kineosporiaceae bacterium]